MAFNYQSVGPQGQTALSPTAKDIQCKSIKLDFSVTNAATGVALDIGALPKDAQIVMAMFTNPTTVTGPSVTAATMLLTVGGYAVYSSGTDIFTSRTGLTPTSSAYFNNVQNITTDQRIVFTPALTGGTTATGGVLYFNLFFVV